MSAEHERVVAINEAVDNLVNYLQSLPKEQYAKAMVLQNRIWAAMNEAGDDPQQRLVHFMKVFAQVTAEQANLMVAAVCKYVGDEVPKAPT
jgi:hypothetical protein